MILVEKNPTLGGRTAQLYRYFPKLCHPHLRPGDQPAPHQGQPARARADAGRGRPGSTGSARRLHGRR
ncbi:MAG: hypothetical protein MZV65_48555 [Chromatiales bacterium]|nr:hypothetical protein [Chromatiales bacterium]